MPNGLPYSHCFTVLGVVTLSDAAGTKLVKIRNQEGETYKGDWSDKSAKWTPALRKEAGSTIADDGEYFISHTDYKKYFTVTQINYNIDKMSRAHFLILNDPSTNTRQGGKCKGTCSYHKFFIKSSKT